jgi:hypothetical protein
MRAEASGWGLRTGAKESTVSRVIESSSLRNSGFVDGVGCVGVGGKRNSEPTEEVNATISTPYRRERIFSATAPAATLPMVSLALALPPPLEARTPYFSWYVQSA